ncbi:MAG: class II glutamine amidotransferase [Pyrinomonadaceae bacterium]
MCRFVYYQGLSIGVSELVTKPENSLINQSFHSRERKEPLNGDGFGVAWYPNATEQPALFKSISPAWSNQNLREIARVVYSSRILGHVRAASPDSQVNEINAHPFRFENLTFMHNGDLGGFRKFRRTLLNSLSEESFQMIKGGTDSEHMFAVIIDEFKGIRDESNDVLRMGMAIERGIDKLLDWRRSIVPKEHFYINCLITNGQVSAACRFTTNDSENAATLYSHLGKRYHCENSKSVMVNCKKEDASVLISSEPLTDDPSWQSVTSGHLVMIDENQKMEMRQLELRVSF